MAQNTNLECKRGKHLLLSTRMKNIIFSVLKLGSRIVVSPPPPPHLPFSLKTLPAISKEFGLRNLSTQCHIGPEHIIAAVADSILLNGECL